MTLIHDKDIRKTKVVYIEWIDSMAINGWRHGSAMTKELAEPSIVCSVGYLIKDEPEFLTISTSISAGGSVMDPLSVPKCAITKRRSFK